MGQWSNINNKKSLYERITGREEGREDTTAAYRSKLRSEEDTAKMDDLPDTRRGAPRMSRADRKAADKILKQGKPARKPRR
jgi:hypothetical protein